jgi:glycosyltransferase involved in cell wall biosynthesis
MEISVVKDKVLIIIRGLDIGGFNGGGDRFGIELAKTLDPSQYHVSICIFFRYNTKNETFWENHLRDKKVDFFYATEWTGKYDLRSYLDGIRTLQRQFVINHYDICHSHFHLGTMAALYLKLFHRHVKIIHTSHLNPDDIAGIYSKVRKWLFLDWIYPICLYAEVGVSKEIAANRSASPGARMFERKILYIPNAISLTNEDNPENCSDLPKFSLDRHVIGSIGRLTEQKGYTFLLRSIPNILKEIPQIDLILVGDGEQRDYLMGLAEELGIRSHVHFLGRRNDIIKLFSIMELFVLPSLWEGLPTVILESMACGIPVVATEIPGTNELINHMVNGLLVPPRESTALTEAILYVIKNPNMMKQIIQSGIETSKFYTIGEVAKQYEHLYITPPYGS